MPPECLQQRAPGAINMLRHMSYRFQDFRLSMILQSTVAYLVRTRWLTAAMTPGGASTAGPTLRGCQLLANAANVEGLMDLGRWTWLHDPWCDCWLLYLTSAALGRSRPRELGEEC